MTDPSGPAAAPAPVSFFRRWEIALPIVVVGWRLTWYPPETAWRDWVLILALYWIFTLRAGNTRAWPPVTALVALGLSLIYLYRQLPHSFEAIRFGLFS